MPSTEPQRLHGGPADGYLVPGDAREYPVSRMLPISPDADPDATVPMQHGWYAKFGGRLIWMGWRQPT